MGVYDYMLIEPGIDLPNYTIETKSYQLPWQTRGFRDPMFRLHVIGEDGYIYRADQKFDENGFAQGHGETGTYTFLEEIFKNEDYSGYPREYSDFDWYRIRFIGEIRVTAQTDDYDGLFMYDLDFDRHKINNIKRIEDNFTADDTNLSVGDTVFDKQTDSFEIVKITDDIAGEYVAKEEVKERGHTIYEEKTVADLNPGYPADDRVIIVSPIDSDKRIAWPESRIAKNIFDCLEV